MARVANGRSSTIKSCILRPPMNFTSRIVSPETTLPTALARCRADFRYQCRVLICDRCLGVLEQRRIAHCQVLIRNCAFRIMFRQTCMWEPKAWNAGPRRYGAGQAGINASCRKLLGSRCFPDAGFRSHRRAHLCQSAGEDTLRSYSRAVWSCPETMLRTTRRYR